MVHLFSTLAIANYTALKAAQLSGKTVFALVYLLIVLFKLSMALIV
jgi:hypothetical protein